MSRAPRARWVPGDGMLHPLALGAVALLALNDHWGKHAFPGGLTGKLSDVAGLCFFPLLLQAAWELATGARAPSRRVLVACAALTATVFALCKTWEGAAELYREGVGLVRWALEGLGAWAWRASLGAPLRVAMTRDVTDLWALPAVLVAVRAGWRRGPYRAIMHQGGALEGSPARSQGESPGAIP